MRAFCRDARFLVVVRPRAVEAETAGASCRTEALQRMLKQEDSCANTALYMLLRAADHFHATYGHYPGAPCFGVVLRAVRAGVFHPQTPAAEGAGA